jgi:hypothetical protein
VKPACANSLARPYLEKPFTTIGLMEWLKVKALSSRPSTTKKKKKKEKKRKQCGVDIPELGIVVALLPQQPRALTRVRGQHSPCHGAPSTPGSCRT